MTVPATLAAALADRYALERELGQGGMATVYLATDVRHQRRVAIKVLHEELGSVVGVERFLKEIQLTAALQHPHILPLFDSGTADGRVFYVMPFVDGETLRTRLTREQQLPVADALRITQEIASALSYAHQRGVIHRDIKPENILLQGGQALVADFGIALAATQAGGGRLTQTGISLGTPQYMSPEQAMGDRAVDARTDLFALGAMAYEMLAGEPPFSGPSVQAIVSKVLTSQPVPVDELRRSVPEPAAAAIMSALEKLPADRPASAEQFVQLLTGAAAAPVGRTSGARPGATRPPAWRRALPWVAGAMAGAVVATTWWRSIETTDARPASSSLAVRFVQTLPTELELQAVCCGQMFDLTPDGRTMVFQARERLLDSTQLAAPQRLFARQLDQLAVRELPGTDSATALSVSPDGQQVAYVAGRRLFRTPVAGGTPTLVATLPVGFVGGTTWRGDNEVLAAVGLSLYSHDLRTGQPRRVFVDSLGDRQVVGLSTIAATGTVLFSLVAYDGNPDVYALAPSDSVPTRLMPGATARYVEAWRALVVNRQGRLLAFPFDPTTLDTLGAGVVIADGNPLRSPVVAHAEYAVAATGTLVVTRRLTRDESGWAPFSYVSLRDGETERAVITQLGSVGPYAAFSRDSRRVALTGLANRGDRALYVYDVSRGATQVVPDSSGPVNVAFTDAGDTLIYTVGRTLRMRARPTDGSGAPIDLAPMSGWQRIDRLSVHGTVVVLAGAETTGGRSSDIGWVDRARGGRVTPLVSTSADESEPVLSPDGQWVAYTANGSGRDEVYVTPFPMASTTTLVSTAGGRNAAWSADGRHLSFVDASGAFVEVSFTPGSPPRIGAARILGRRGVVRNFSRSPDGRLILTIDTSRLLNLQGLEVVVNFRPTF